MGLYPAGSGNIYNLNNQFLTKQEIEFLSIDSTTIDPFETDGLSEHTITDKMKSKLPTSIPMLHSSDNAFATNATTADPMLHSTGVSMYTNFGHENIPNSTTTVNSIFDPITTGGQFRYNNVQNVNIGVGLMSYVVFGVTLFFVFVSCCLLRCCVLRRRRIRLAYEGYNQGTNVGCLRWNEEFIPQQPQLAIEGTTNVELPQIIEEPPEVIVELIRVDEIPPPPPMPEIALSDLEPDTKKTISEDHILKFSKENLLVREKLESRLGGIFSKRVK